MALFNYATKEITLKIVYYGPGLSGKTTNLQQLHSILDPEKTGKLLSLATETDRTLFFDFLPIELGKIRDFTIRFQLYTVPGQVKYNATRKVVLKGADAVVFVADSQRESREANIESFTNMRENLLTNNINPDDMPIVLQYNKRDLPDILQIAELNKDLNIEDYVYFEAEAVNGKGVQETFQTASKLLIKDIARKHNLEIQPAVPPPAEPVSAIREDIINEPFEEEKISIEAEESFVSLQEPVTPAEEEAAASTETLPRDFFDEKLFEEPLPPPPQPPMPQQEQVETIIKEISPYPEETLAGITENIAENSRQLNSIKVELEKLSNELRTFKEKQKKPAETIIKDIPVQHNEALDKITENLRENSQLLISTKIEMKRMSDELKKVKEEQKELLTAVLKISETIEGSKTKKGWFR
ncbi:MAG: GTPase domain-containing protein [Nitrospirae bacterium]|nr:GTPase domain-containing protein [Nitrospirota bacterium]